MNEADESVDLQQMRYVVAVADTRNFTRAAERCSVELRDGGPALLREDAQPITNLLAGRRSNRAVPALRSREAAWGETADWV